MKVGLRTAAIVFFLCGSGIVAIAACSNQGEGERCQFANGNDDCNTADNLICYRKEDLNSDSDRCCPVDRTKATTAICTTPIGVGGADASAPADTGPPTTVDASVTDAGEDAADAADAETLDAADSG